MKRSVTLTVLAENSVHGRGLLAEHGLSIWVQSGAGSILFDTGQGLALPVNARLLHAPWPALDAVVLSHGHYDHTGGLAFALEQAPRAKVFAHPHAVRRKFIRETDGAMREVGTVGPNAACLQSRGRAIVRTEKPTEVLPGIIVTGQIPRVTDFEDTGGPFFLDPQGKEPDPLLDDQALFFTCGEGTVILLGCAHAGVVNTLHYVGQLTDHRPIYAVLGGMHLLTASADRLNRTLEAFRDWGAQRFGPAHCTGMTATARLWATLPGRCTSFAVGTVSEFPIT